MDGTIKGKVEKIDTAVTLYGMVFDAQFRKNPKVMPKVFGDTTHTKPSYTF